MKEKSWWVDFALRVLFMDVLVLAVALASGWISGDFSPFAMSDRLFLSGAVVIVVGILSPGGYWKFRADSKNLTAQSAGEATQAERNLLMVKDSYQNYAFVLTMIVAGLVAIIASVLVWQ